MLWLSLVGAGDADGADPVPLDTEDVELYYPAKTVGPRPMNLDIGVWTGIFIPSEAHELYDSTANFHSPLRDLGPTLGARLGFFPWRFAGLELESGYSFITNERNEDNHLINTFGQAVLQWPARWTPFILFGGGFLHVHGGAGEDLDGALQWGLGLKYYPNSTLVLRVDGRHMISGKEGPDTGNTNHFAVTVGIALQLFGREPPPLAVRPLVAAPKPVEPPAVEPPTVEVNKTIYIQTMQPAEFGFDSVYIPKAYMSIVDEVARLVLSRSDLHVVVVGHTDSTGPEAYNEQLSLRRANVIAEVLQEKGVPEWLIQVDGEGEHAPRATNSTVEGRRKNRRTEVTVTDQGMDTPLTNEEPFNVGGEHNNSESHQEGKDGELMMSSPTDEMTIDMETTVDTSPITEPLSEEGRSSRTDSPPEEEVLDGRSSRTDSLPKEKSTSSAESSSEGESSESVTPPTEFSEDETIDMQDEKNGNDDDKTQDPH